MIRLQPATLKNSRIVPEPPYRTCEPHSVIECWQSAVGSVARVSIALFLGCLLAAALSPVAWATAAGEIKKVSVDPEQKAITLESKGELGEHSARVMSSPNRLVVDFRNTTLGKLPRKIHVGKGIMREIRLGHFKGDARMVLDFGENSVPGFKITREGPRMVVQFTDTPQAKAAPDDKQVSEKREGKTPSGSHLEPSAMPAAAEQRPELKFPTMKLGDNIKASDKKTSPASPKSAAKGSDAKSRPSKPAQLAQATGLRPIVPKGSSEVPSGARRGNAREPEPPDRKSAAVGNDGQGMVREAKPPVTPPTPDPRLLVQEVTELKFTQVGHNARLIIRGGDRLDYRMTKVSPTKLRIDLVNAEIPKAHQKPLKTEQFSTSVEMIVPGSQTVFVQLKDAVPYQVQKQKGVLMIDFPPPRFALTQDQRAALGAAGEQELKGDRDERRRALLDKREAIRISKQQSLDRDAKKIDEQLDVLNKQREEIIKERQEIDKKYPPVTPDPKVFSKPVTMDFQGIALRNAFRLLAEQAGINIILGPEVTGTTTLRLFKVPLGQVFDHLLVTHGLKRDLRGNVMWIGSADNIDKNRKARLQDRKDLLDRIREKLNESDQRRREFEKEKEKLRKELEKVEEVEEAPAETPGAVETVGATETIEIDGEPVTLLLVQVRLSYRKPAEIENILNCVFNNKCRGLKKTPEEAAASAREQYTQDLGAIGFQEGSPGAQARMRTFQQEQQRERRTQAMEQTAAAQQQERLAAALQAPAMDARMRRILAHTVIWPNDEFGMIFIKDLPERIEDMKRMIAALDVPTPQVLIEARLVQADRSWSRGLGVQWGGRNAQTGPVPPPGTQGTWGLTGLEAGAAADSPAGGQTSFTGVENLIPSRFVVNLPGSVAGFGTTTPLIGLGLQFGLLAGTLLDDLDLRIQMGEANGKAKSIARPKVQVIDKKPANIIQGRTIAYATVSAEGTQVQLVPVNLELTVTPRIYPDGRIQMELSVSDNDVGDTVNGFASILTRSAKTSLIVKDGETAVIGGITRKTDTSGQLGFPGLMHVPVFNYLFSNKSKEQRVVELLVFVTPTVIKRPPPAS